MADFQEKLGIRIRARRSQLGLTQDQVADTGVISKKQLSDIELGKRGIGFEKMARLSKVLKRSMDWFVK